MEFPAEMLIDYVRVYQRKGQTNTGCDPKDFPTANYIANHMDAYTSEQHSLYRSKAFLFLRLLVHILSSNTI